MKNLNIGDLCHQQIDALMRALTHDLDHWYKLEIRNSNRPKTDPCGMLCVSVSIDELISFMLA